MKKISTELADLKTSLAKANDQMAKLQGLVDNHDRGRDDEHSQASSPMDFLAKAEKALKWARTKSKVMETDSGLFADSCWNMCLDIFICDLKNELITISSVAHSSGIPMTTAVRYINVMAAQGLLEKTLNPSDQRMTFVSTSAAGKEKITKLLADR